MSSLFHAARLGVVAVLSVSALQAAEAGVDVRVSFAQSLLVGDVDVEALVTITNSSGAPVRLPKTQQKERKGYP